MSKKIRALFSIDLRIDRQVIKLNIYDDDTEQRLIRRICQHVHSKQYLGDKLRTKLTQCFRQLLTNDHISDKIRNKIQSLLEDNRKCLKDNDADHSISNIQNETPFHILQESLQCHKKSQQKIKKHYNYLNDQSLFLDYSREEKNKLTKEQYAFKPIQKRQQIYSLSLNKKIYKGIHQQRDLCGIFEKNYKQINRKYEGIIVKDTNFKDSNKYDLDRNRNTKLEIQNIFPYDRQTKKIQTFQNYKINRMADQYYPQNTRNTILNRIKQNNFQQIHKNLKNNDEDTYLKYHYS